MAPKTLLGTTLEESRVRESSLAAPSHTRAGKPQNYARDDLNSQSLRGEPGSTDAHSWQYMQARAEVTSWNSAREWERFWQHLELDEDQGGDWP